MSVRNLLFPFGAAVLLAACPRPEAPATAAASPVAVASSVPQPEAHGIAWIYAGDDAEVDAAFAQARAEQKPVFLYWGAVWCPPCNQVKATIFNRQEFIERSRAFVPVYIDGDSPGAQKLGTRFKVSGYPTMVLFNPAGTELTRLPGEVDAQQYQQVLTLGMNALRPVKEVVAAARAGGQGLTPNDWKLLAFYSWDTDEQQVVSKAGTPALLRQLSLGCPPAQADSANRLFLKALAAREEDANGRPAGKPDPAARERLLKVLADAEQSHVQMDVLAYNAQELVRAVNPAKGSARQQLVDAFDASLSGLANDSTLSRADRLNALIARAQLANIDAPKSGKHVPSALLADVREQVARADREVTDGHERQAVISTAADLLEEAGVPGESDALLRANLSKSHSPYYLMLGLASNARKRGDTAEALRWYQEAFSKSEGPATRLQWGASYLMALVDLSPGDDARIEHVATQLFHEAAAQPNAFYARSAHSLQRVGGKLATWQKSGGHAATVKRLRTLLAGICPQVPQADGQRRACESLLKSQATA